MDEDSQFNIENFLKQNQGEVDQKIDQYLDDIESGDFLEEGARPFPLK